MTDPEELSTGRSQRFVQWVAFLFFSTITLASAVETSKTHQNNNSNEDWAVVCSAITFALTLIVVAMQLHPVGTALITGTKVEGVLILILVAFWAAAVSVISDANNNLAVSADGTVINGNLYYFSWAGFVCSVMLLVSYLRAVFGVDLAGELRNRSERLTIWSALLAAQLVVMGASANIFDRYCNPNTELNDAYCGRTMFGIVLGVLGTVTSIGVVFMKIAASSVPFMVECIAAVGLAVLNAFGVAYLTSAYGPGKPLGNLYYFSWISLVSSALLVAGCFETYKSGGESAATNSHSAGTEMTPGVNGNKSDDIPVESLDHDDNI